ncbi:hypothetical protein EV363DRAFT_1174655, partial [Boletus edulis]
LQVIHKVDDQTSANPTRCLVIGKCDNILSAVQGLLDGRGLIFDNISPQEYSYLEEQLDCLGTCVRQFVITMPLDTHKVFVAPVISQWNTEFSWAHLSNETFSISIEVATGHLIICPDELTTFQDLVVVKSVYSQSETNVLKKFERYIQCNPTPLTLLMIKIKDNYSKPSSSPDLAAVRHCINKETLSEVEFKQKAERYSYQVIHEGISWIDVTQMEMHLLLHLGDKPINLTVKNFNHPETAYVFNDHGPVQESYLEADRGHTTDCTLLHPAEGKVAISMAKTVHTRYGNWHLSLPKWPFSEIDNNGEDGPMKRAGHTDAPASTNGSQPTSKWARSGMWSLMSTMFNMMTMTHSPGGLAPAKEGLQRWAEAIMRMQFKQACLEVSSSQPVNKMAPSSVKKCCRCTNAQPARKKTAKKQGTPELDPATTPNKFAVQPRFQLGDQSSHFGFKGCLDEAMEDDTYHDLLLNVMMASHKDNLRAFQEALIKQGFLPAESSDKGNIAHVIDAGNNKFDKEDDAPCDEHSVEGRVSHGYG